MESYSSHTDQPPVPPPPLSPPPPPPPLLSTMSSSSSSSSSSPPPPDTTPPAQGIHGMYPFLLYLGRVGFLVPLPLPCWLGGRLLRQYVPLHTVVPEERNMLAKFGFLNHILTFLVVFAEDAETRRNVEGNFLNYV